MTLEQWENSTLKNYKAKFKPSEDEVIHVLDFLKAHPAERLKRASYPQILKKAEAWTLRLNKQSKHLKEAGLVKVIHEFSNGLKFVRLLDQNAKAWEGKQMGHCVASYTTHPGIYSLRDSEHIPHVTVEIQDSVVRQAVGKGNGAIPLKYLSLMTKILKKVDKHNCCMRGYQEISKSDYNFIETNFTNANIIKWEGKFFKDRKFEPTLKPHHQIKNYTQFKRVVHDNLYSVCTDTLTLYISKVSNIQEHHASAIKHKLKDDALNILSTSSNHSSTLWSHYGYQKVTKTQAKFLSAHFEEGELRACGKYFMAKGFSRMTTGFKKARPEYLEYFLTPEAVKVISSTKSCFMVHEKDSKMVDNLCAIVLQFLETGYNPVKKEAAFELSGAESTEEIIDEVLRRKQYHQISKKLASFIESYFINHKILKMSERYYLTHWGMQLVKNPTQAEWRALNEEINYPSFEGAGYSSEIVSFFCSIFMKTV